MAKEQRSVFINDEFDLGLALSLIRKSLLRISLFCLIGFIAAFIKIRYSMPEYEARATVKIEDKNEMGSVMQYENIYESNINGEISRLKSMKLFEQATMHLPLEVSYYSTGRFMDTENYKLSAFQVKHQIKSYSAYQKPINIDFVSELAAVISYQDGDSVFSKIVPLNQWVSLSGLELKLVVPPANINGLIASPRSYYFIINSKSYVLNKNYSSLKVEVVDITAKTIGITFQGNSAAKVADLANSLAERFLDFNVEKKKEGANQMIAFTNEQIDKVNARIAYYERMLQPYRKFEKNEEGYSSVQLTAELLKKIEDEKIVINKNIKELDGFLTMLKNDATYSELYTKIIASPDNRHIQAVTVNLRRLLLDRRDKIFRLKEDSYEFKELDYKIGLEKKDLLEVLKGLLKEQKQDIIDLTERGNQYQGKTEGKDFAYDKDYMHLSRMYEINREYYTKLLSKKAEYEMVRAGYVSDNEIIESAVPPTNHIKPDEKMIYLYFIGAGFMLGLILLVIKYLLHNTITSAKDITKYPEVLLLGMVPSAEGEMPVSQLLVSKNPKSLMSEAFRSIRTNLQFLSNDDGAKVIAITSTLSGEGKTFVAINLSGIIAFSEKKVVILDLDLRKPKIHLGFGVQNTVGMSSLLIGKSQLNDVIQKSSLPNLDFITAGPVPPNPAELILGKTMFQVIDELKEQYDVVVIDNPPVGVVTDAFPILQKADYPIYVLRSGVSKKSFLENVAVLKKKDKIENLSVILNGVEKGSRYEGYGAYGVYGGYGGYGTYGYTSGYYYDDTGASKRKGLFRLLRRKK